MVAPSIDACTNNRSLDGAARSIDSADRSIARNIQTDRQTYRQADRRTDRHTGRQTDRQTYRQADRQTDRHTGRQTDGQTQFCHCNDNHTNTCKANSVSNHSMTGTWHSSTAHHKSPYNIRISFNSGLRINITELSAGCISTVSERKVLGGCTACSVIR